MPDLADGESTTMQGSGAKPYELKNTGGVYSCSCPAWRNQSTPIEKRTCKHLRKFRGEAAEVERIGNALPGKPVKAPTVGGTFRVTSPDSEKCMAPGEISAQNSACGCPPEAWT